MIRQQTAWASDLGWPPGHRPQTFAWAGYVWTFRGVERDREGDVVHFIYRSADGSELLVWND